MVQITLYNYNGKDNVINKTLVNGVTVDGTIKDTANVITPSLRLRVKPTLQNLARFNYAYIAALNRYYFVENCEIISADIFILSLRVDVLKTYENAIRQSTATITERVDANKYISNRVAIHDIRPQFDKIAFSVSEPFDETGAIIMITLKGN